MHVLKSYCTHNQFCVPQYKINFKLLGVCKFGQKVHFKVKMDSFLTFIRIKFIVMMFRDAARSENLRGGGRESMKSISCEVAWVLLYFMLSFISLKVSSVKLNFNLNLFKYASFSPCSALFESCD